MKKTLFLMVLTAVALVSFTGCEEMVVSSDQTIDLVPKATISGIVTAELNLQSSGLEFVPEGTQLLIEVNYSDINPASTGKWQDTITVGTNGTFSALIPTDANGVNVSILPFTFEYDQIQPYGSLNTNIRKTFSVTAVTNKAISSGQSITIDIQYDKIAAAPSFIDKVRIKGKFTANLNQETGGNENVPDGTVIIFYNGTWKDSIVVTNGTYTISVPKGITLTVKSKFTYSKKVWNLTTSTYTNINYEFKYDAVRTFNTMDEVVDIVAANSGEGTDLTVYPIVSLVTGKAQADLDESTVGLEKIPNDTIIKFWTTTTPIWGKTAAVTNGTYSVSAPKDQTVYWSTKFTYLKKVAMIDPQSSSTVYVNEQFEYNINGSGSFTNNESTLNISAAGGTSINPTVTISGNAKVELDDTSAGLENIPNNTLIRFYYPNNTGAIKNVYVSNGTYTIDIPKGRSVTFTGTFNATKKAGGVSTTKTFTIAGSFIADDTKTVEIIATTN